MDSSVVVKDLGSINKKTTNEVSLFVTSNCEAYEEPVEVVNEDLLWLCLVTLKIMLKNMLRLLVATPMYHLRSILLWLIVRGLSTIGTPLMPTRCSMKIL